MSGDENEKPKTRDINKHHDKYKDQAWDKELLNKGPVDDSNRSCRDILCCLIFLVFLAGCVVVTILGFSQGNPDAVLYPYDEQSRQCGFQGLADYPYLYFYAAVSNLKTINTTGVVQGVCVSSCPTNFTGKLNCTPTVQNKDCSVNKIDFYVSIPFLQRFCVPDPNFFNTTPPATITINGTTYQALPSTNQQDASSLISTNIINTDKLIAWVSDCVTTWPVLLGSLGFSFIIAIIYLIIVRFCAGIIAYITILLIEAALLGLGYVFYARWQYYVSVKDANYELTMKVLCGLFFGLAGVFFLIIVFMCNRIRLAIALVQVTAKYLASTCSVFFVPFIFYTISAFYYCYWVALSVYIYSSGTVTKSDGTFLPQVQWNSTTRYAWWYHLFALFYINAFLNAYNQFVLASSACVWYFEHRIEGGPVRPVSKGFYRGIRYHLGSIAFGSLIVAIIRFMMAVVEYIKQKVDSSGVTDKAGKIFKCLLTCCQCCLECIARLVEYINKHAYIQIALKGDNFCVSAFEGFGLVFRNLGRWSMLFMIGGIFNIIGYLFISSATGLVGYLLITYIDYFNSKLNSPVIPTMVCGFVGFIVGAISMGLYGTSGDALMHCFLLDEEINDKMPKHTPTELQSFIKEERS